MFRTCTQLFCIPRLSLESGKDNPRPCPSGGPLYIWRRAWPQVAREASSYVSCRGFFLYIYIYIYTAHTLAHTWSHVCLKTYIYTARTLKRICLGFAALCELNPLVSRGRRYKFERPCRANAVAGKGFVLRWPAHTLRIPKNSNSDVLPALPRHPGCAYGRCLAHTPRRIPIQS